MFRHVLRAALAVVGVALIVGSLAGPALAADKFVTMYANEYRPGVVTINVGDTVTWVNDDDVPHDAVGNGWRTEILGYFAQDSVRFSRAGRFPYYCSIHPEMRSAVIVRGAGGGSGGGPRATVPPTDTVLDLKTGRGSGVAVVPILLVGGAALVALAVLGLRPQRAVRPPTD
jgi:plastocyanin